MESLLSRLPPGTDPKLRDEIAHALEAAEKTSPPPPSPARLLDDDDVTFRKKIITTPKGKTIDLKDAEQWAKRRKEATFDVSFKYTAAKGFHVTVKAIYDKLFSFQGHYVFNIGSNPLDPSRQELDLDVADERQAIKIGSVTVFQLDQSQAFSWLQQAFGDERPEIFLNIRATDDLCATAAYDELRRHYNPINPRIQEDAKEKFKTYLSTPLGPTTFDERCYTILRLRTELRSKGTDVSAYKVMYKTVDALRSTGGHWATFVDGSKVQRFTDMDKGEFTEDLLTEFFDVLLQREYDLKGKGDGFVNPGNQDKGGAPQGGAESGHLADTTRRARHQHTCKYHPGRKVNHTEDRCRENPKNKTAKQDDNGKDSDKGDEGGAAGGDNEKKSGFENIICYKCGERGHIKADCPVSSMVWFTQH